MGRHHRRAAGVLLGTVALLAIAPATQAFADEVTVDGQQVPISDDPLVGGVQQILLEGPPGPVELYQPLASPSSGGAAGAFGNLVGPVIGTVLDQIAPEPDPGCTDDVCGVSLSDLVGP